MVRFTLSYYFLISIFFLTGCEKAEQPAQQTLLDQTGQELAEIGAGQKSLNVLLIVVDDVAFNDLGIFGGEINTPNIDSLAGQGVVFTHFLAAPNCSPTRAMLLSGTDSHIAGLGNMFEEMAGNQKDLPGYEGYLNFRVAALPELFQDAGYHTYMTGKWHLGLTEETSPAARGFEKSFALLQGGAGAFSNMLPIIGPDKAKYREDHKMVESLPDDFYSTRFYTERMIEYIDGNRHDGKPFFAYLAFTSPHWPLQAPQESIAKYKGKYDEGYEVLRARRLQALKDLQLVAEDVEPFPRFPGEPAWEQLTEAQQKYEARKMEIYAAMIDDVDIYIGKVIDYLKRIGEYENTFIFFMSDNGPEAHHLERGWDGLAEFVAGCCDNSYENLGNADSYIWYGPNWGQAGNTPLRMYKGFPSRGGVRVPAFAYFPEKIRKGIQYDKVLTVMDVMPTLLDLAGIEHPGNKKYKGREVVSMKGKTMLPVMTGEAETLHADDYVIGWELFAKRALQQGDWRILYEPYHEVLEPRVARIETDTWQLYNIADDPAEINDLAEQYPERLAEMIKLWDSYAKENGVVIPDSISGY